MYTAIGPAVARADAKEDSSPLETVTIPVAIAPIPLDLNLQ